MRTYPVLGRLPQEEGLPHARRRRTIVRRDVRRAKLFVSASCVWSKAPESFYSHSAAAAAAMNRTRNIVVVVVVASALNVAVQTFHIVVKELPRLASCVFCGTNDDDSSLSE